MAPEERSNRSAPAAFWAARINLGRESLASASWWVLGTLFALLALVLGASFMGWLGPLVLCGADGAAVCVAWPGFASAGLWAAFIGLIVGLLAVQARSWRDTSVASRELALLAALMAAALLERTWRADLAQVAYDEAAAASLVGAWHFQGLFPLTGIVSSVGVPNPPGWPYLLALALLPFDSPYALVAQGVIVGLAAVLLTWWVGRRWVGPWGALAAAVFCAGGFWASVLGRGAWQPAFLQAPVILCLDALLLLAVRHKPWALAIACGWLGLMVQLHYIAVLFALVVPLAAWPARRTLRPVHLVAAALTCSALLTPFLIYELHPMVRLRDVGSLLGDAGGVGSHWDLESWNLVWTLAANGGAAGLGGPDADGLRQLLGRWTQLGWLGVPLVGLGLVAALAGWPRGTRGMLIVAWFAAPVIGLAHHTLGVLFHYLYLALPGMALSVGALAEWVARRAWQLPRLAVASALAIYVAVSTAMLLVVLQHVERTGEYSGLGRPLGENLAAAEAALRQLRPGQEVLIGGYFFQVEMLRFSLGYHVPSRLFDDCAQVPASERAVYLLNSERTPAARALSAEAGAPLERIPRPNGDAFLVFGPVQQSLSVPPETDRAACASRWR